MSRQGATKSLVAKRSIRIRGELVSNTPLLVPSFSSKGFPNLQKLYDNSAEIITDTCLVSAYDISYGHLKVDIPFVDFLFLDSGGYESSKDHDLSDLNYQSQTPKSWTKKRFEHVLSEWESATPTFLISYDHPKQRLDIREQIEHAEELFDGRRFGREILIKPSVKGNSTVDVHQVVRNVHRLAQFDVIGVTEKELGESPLQRMVSIAKIRTALTEAGLDLPIHIFGSLDTISSPLYFLAGADIFDGLTWLRLAYYKGLTVYVRNMAILDMPSKTTDNIANAQMLAGNYRSLQLLQGDMNRFLVDHDFGEFAHHGDLFRRFSMDLAAG